MKIRLLFFGRPRERLDTAGESADIPAHIVSLAELLSWLRARGGSWAHELDETRVRCAINQRMAELSEPIGEQDEIAIFSPISGG